jgi:hypothetical protein
MYSTRVKSFNLINTFPKILRSYKYPATNTKKHKIVLRKFLYKNYISHRILHKKNYARGHTIFLDVISRSCMFSYEGIPVSPTRTFLKNVLITYTINFCMIRYR